jgi:hypothetical protein
LKKWKIVLIAFFVLIIASASYLVYELKFKTYDVADEQVNEIVEQQFEIELPDGTIAQVDHEGNVSVVNEDGTVSQYEDLAQLTNALAQASNNVSGTTTEANNNSNSSEQNGSTSNSNAPTNSPNTTERITVATIKAKYEPTMGMLEEQTRTRLNALIGQAKDEYTTKKNNGEKISYGYFYRKYTGAAASLEASTDAAVAAVIKAVEAELTANGFAASHAASLTEQYNATKEKLRSELMKKTINF